MSWEKMVFGFFGTTPCIRRIDGGGKRVQELGPAGIPHPQGASALSAEVAPAGAQMSLAMDCMDSMDVMDGVVA